MSDRELAEHLHRDQVLATRALATVIIAHLPDKVQSRLNSSIANGTGTVEIRTRIESGQAELVLIAIDGSEPLSIASTPPQP